MKGAAVKTRNHILGAPFAMDYSLGRRLILPDDYEHELVTPESVGMLPPFGGSENGYQVRNDILTQTTDGRPLQALWDEFVATVAIHNERRQTLIDLLSFPVTNVIEDVPTLTGGDFEEASEFGVPQAIRPGLGYFSMGYTFKWYDAAVRYTWQFLADASSSQVEASHQTVLDADNRLVFNKVMSALFTNTNRSATINGQNYTVYALYNGDGTVPPPYKSNTFSGSYTHYITSGAATIDSGDLDDITKKLTELGYGAANGTQLFLMVNPNEGKIIRTFRANVANNNGAVALYDFVPATNQPALIVPNPQGLIGSQVGGSYKGLTVIGSYGFLTIIEEEYIPAGYIVCFGSGGDANLNNPVGIREHANPALRGLRLVSGPNQDYPLIDSTYQRGFGTGIRQRGAAAITQITASGTYTPPAVYSTP